MAKVVKLKGQPVPEPGEPTPGLVERIEKLLELAKAGEIMAVAGAVAWNDRTHTHFFTGPKEVPGYGIIGCLHTGLAHWERCISSRPPVKASPLHE